MKPMALGILLGVLIAGLVPPLGLTPAAAQAPQDAKQQKPEPKPQEGGATISVEVPVVTLDVVAATQHGDIITGLKKENFRVLEDGAPQTISSFAPTDAPITAAEGSTNTLPTRPSIGRAPSFPTCNKKIGSL